MFARGPLPTFFVIGASKSGTTSLNRYLSAHPAITMAEPQEAHQLLGPRFEERLGNYSRLFTGDGQIRGECSSGYTNYPYNAEIVDRIAGTVPDARLIYIVRDPVDRAVAHYAQHVIRGDERRDVDSALNPTPDNYYVAASRYGTQIERYLRRFDQASLLVVDQADLRERRRETLARIFEHVGASASFWDPSYSDEHNVRSGSDAQNVKLSEAGRWLREGPLNRLSRRALPESVRAALVNSLRRRLGTEVLPEPNAETIGRLRAALAPEAERTRALTDQGFPGWSV